MQMRREVLELHRSSVSRVSYLWNTHCTAEIPTLENHAFVRPSTGSTAPLGLQGVDTNGLCQELPHPHECVLLCHSFGKVSKKTHIQSCNVASPPGWYQVHPLKLGAQGTRATQSKRSGRTVFTQGLKCCFGFVQVPKCRHVQKTSS